MGFTVERCKNGASHQGGAAQACQNRSTQPAYGHAAAVKISV
jgi:hypothetical protein